MRTGSTKGFTLIELLIVIAIIGILAAVLIPQLMRARSVAVDRAAQGYAQNIYTAANAYLAENVTASNADVLTGDCTGGYDAAGAGQYGTTAPSFDATACTVTANGSDVTVSVDYNGGTQANATINP